MTIISSMYRKSHSGITLFRQKHKNLFHFNIEFIYVIRINKKIYKQNDYYTDFFFYI